MNQLFIPFCTLIRIACVLHWFESFSFLPVFAFTNAVKLNEQKKINKIKHCVFQALERRYVNSKPKLNNFFFFICVICIYA